MMKNKLIWITAYLLPSVVLASESTPRTPQWYELVGGVLAIPAAVLGLAYSYILIKKTRLESRKTELEIREKEEALEALPEEEQSKARELVAPIIEEKSGKYLILRFVLMYVTLQLWGLITSAFSFVAGGVFLGAQKLTEGTMTDNDWIMWIFYAILNIPKIVTWLIIIGIGWPLFKDLNDYLNLDIKKLILPWKK